MQHRRKWVIFKFNYCANYYEYVKLIQRHWCENPVYCLAIVNFAYYTGGSFLDYKEIR